MIYALVENKKAKAHKGLKGFCPLCDEQLIPKCGNYKVHHWSHKNDSDCDSWAEGETEWHLNWKSFFPEDNQEVTVIDEVTKEKHRADIKTNNNMVIELQNSSISDEQIEIRTRFYKKIIWIVNGLNYGNTGVDFFHGLSKNEKNNSIYDFTYFGYSKMFDKWGDLEVPVFIDFNKPDLYWIKRYDKVTKKGVVQIVNKEELIVRNGGTIPPGIIEENICENKDEKKDILRPNQYQRMRAYLSHNRRKF